MSTVESWNDTSDSEAGKVLVQYAKALESRLDTYVANLELYAAVYSERLEVALRPSRRRNLQPASQTKNANLTFNVARSLCDTEHATVTEAMPRPTFLTEDANQPQQDKAKQLQFAIDGLLSDLRGYAIIEECELDKNVFGAGVHKVHSVNGRPAIERVLISDLLVDEDLIGPGQDPKQIIHRMEVSRAAMLVYFRNEPEWVRKAIKAAPAIASSGIAGQRQDKIVVYDAYTAPIDEEHPGLHGVAIENCDKLIFKEPWESPRLPFVIQYWQRPRIGFYPVGVIEQVLGIQVEINKFFRNMSKALTRWGGVTCLLPTGSKINPLLWTNAPEGKFIPYDPLGGQPVFMNGPKLSPEEINWLQFQIDTAYKATGIPQNVAFAQREPGIPSASGQRQLAQKAASRLAPQSKQYERGFVNTAWLLDDVLRRLVEDGEKLVISTVDQGALHRVNIDEAISLEPGTYHIDVYAGNFLSKHPATAFDQVESLAEKGIFSKQEVRELIDMPDIKAKLGGGPDVKATYLKQIKQALSRGVLVPPEDFHPLEVGVPLYRAALFEAQNSGVAEDRLNVLRDWIKRAKDIMRPPPQVGPDGQPIVQQQQAPQQQAA